MEDLVTTMFQKIDELNAMIKGLEKYGIDYANAEREYKMILSQNSIKLKESGMAVTLIDKVIYGVKEVAEARFMRDTKEVLYNVAQEKINITKLQLRILENQTQREWGGTGHD